MLGLQSCEFLTWNFTYRPFQRTRHHHSISLHLRSACLAINSITRTPLNFRRSPDDKKQRATDVPGLPTPTIACAARSRRTARKIARRHDRVLRAEGCDSNEGDEKTRHANGKNRKAWRLNDAPRSTGSRGELTLFASLYRSTSTWCVADCTGRPKTQTRLLFSKSRCTTCVRH